MTAGSGRRPYLLALGALAMLAACADGGDQPQSVADEVVPGLHDQWRGPQPDALTAEPVVGWLNDDRLGIVTFGSSSCVPVASELRVHDPGTIHVSFEPSPHDPCTADMSAATHVFTVPPDVTEHPIEVRLIYPDSTERSLLLD